MLFQFLVAPLAPPQGTLVCRGTLVGNHWSNGYMKILKLIYGFIFTSNKSFYTLIYEIRCPKVANLNNLGVRENQI